MVGGEVRQVGRHPASSVGVAHAAQVQGWEPACWMSWSDVLRYAKLYPSARVRAFPPLKSDMVLDLASVLRNALNRAVAIMSSLLSTSQCP